jgi:hypoxia up-regulated 1
MALPRLWRSTPVLLLLLGAALLQPSAGSLMGVDLGLSYVKVSVARPGKGLELVTNEQAKRKTPAAVGFTEDGERLFGDAAIAYSGKAPDRVVLDGRNLIGQCAAEAGKDSLRCPRKVVTVGGTGDFSGEHVVAMQLAMARRQASAALDGASVKDVVVSVPAWFDHHDRAAVADSARVIGLNCLAIVNANTAAAVKYALDGKGRADERAAKGRGKAARTQTVMFYDLGAGSATASIAQIVTDSKTGAASSVKMLGHEWERDVGGRAFDQVVLERLADDFDAQRGAGATPARELPRVIMRLRKEAQRVREILSANTKTVVNVPSLHDDIDFRTTARRADFESGAAESFARAVGPARKVLDATGLSVDDLDAVVPFGGASRTPRVQELLCEALGIASLNKSINSDEAAVMGTAFFAASLSSTFRVRKMDIEDVYGRAVSAEVERDRASGGMFSSSKAKPEPQKVVIFRGDVAKMPSKKTLSFKREGDFSIDVYVDADKAGAGRYPGRTLYSRAKISGVAKVLSKLKDPSNGKALVPQISLTVLMDISGFVRIGTAESAVDEVVEVEREVPVKDEKKDKANKTSKADKSEPTGGKGKDKREGEGGAEGSPDGAAEASPDVDDGGATGRSEEKKGEEKPKTRTEKSKQTLVHRQTLTVTYEVASNSLLGVQMEAKELDASRKLLKDLEAADLDRQQRADALNALEGFVLEVRSSVRSAEEGEPLFTSTTAEERDSFVATLDTTEDWMYTDEAKVTKNLEGRLDELRIVHGAMKLRAEEVERRPAAVEQLRELMKTSVEQMTVLRDLHEKSGTKRSATFDEFDTLVADTEKWLTRKEAEQRLLAATATPAFLSSEVDDKLKLVVRKVQAAMRLKLPPPPPPPASEESATLAADDDATNETQPAEPADTGAVEEPNAAGVDSVTADMASESAVVHEEL